MYPRFQRLLQDEPLPCAIVDLDALDHNRDTLLACAGERVSLRLATKSLRCPELIRRLLEHPRIAGMLTFSVDECELLAASGLDDLLLAYPVARAPEARRIARLLHDRRLLTMVDHEIQVEQLAQAARAEAVVAHLCLDVDVSWRPLPGLHLGVRRSPLRSAAAAVDLARTVARTEGVELVGLMAYEAQVAGVPDGGPLVSWMKRRSVALAAARRREVVEALLADGHRLELVNGGGTGSVASTSADPSVTEVTVGSGLYCPHLFDGYRDLGLEPSAFFALPVVRSSDPGLITCAGGGLVASGAVGADRWPKVHLPTGLQPLSLEGWGEVQTPFRVTGEAPALGDPVIARHAKAGELAERFAELLLVRGDRIVGRARTLRGLGLRCG